MLERLSKRLVGHIFPLFVLCSEGLLTLGLHKLELSITSLKGGSSGSADGLQGDSVNCLYLCGPPICCTPRLPTLIA